MLQSDWLDNGTWTIYTYPYTYPDRLNSTWSQLKSRFEKLENKLSVRDHEKFCSKNFR